MAAKVMSTQPPSITSSSSTVAAPPVGHSAKTVRVQGVKYLMQSLACNAASAVMIEGKCWAGLDNVPSMLDPTLTKYGPHGTTSTLPLWIPTYWQHLTQAVYACQHLPPAIQKQHTALVAAQIIGCNASDVPQIVHHVTQHLSASASQADANTSANGLLPVSSKEVDSHESNMTGGDGISSDFIMAELSRLIKENDTILTDSTIQGQTEEEVAMIRDRNTVKCRSRKCRSKNISTDSVQTRSLDEGPTIKHVCLDCGTAWQYRG